MDRTACGRGFVVSFKPADWVWRAYGDKTRFDTYNSYHTALAVFYALTGKVRPAKGDKLRFAGAAVAGPPRSRGPDTVKGPPDARARP